jgi:hypothetical protein
MTAPALVLLKAIQLLISNEQVTFGHSFKRSDVKEFPQF